MKRILLLTLMSFVLCALHAANDGSLSALDSTWMAFRNNHPYGFQTVGLRHSADGCIFVISEPSESVSKEAIAKLFQQYGGETVVKQKQFGYDGWLSDIVGQVRLQSANQEKAFTHDLFTLLYGTDYKAYYTDLDNPQRHVYYSPYELNYSISAAELMTWFIDENEMLRDASGVTKNISSWLASSFQESNKLLFSVERGFVVWLINTKKVSSGDKLFKTNARKFSLDSDLILGAFGKKCGNVAVIAREREVPVDVLPPLRIETLTLLATTSNKSLAQSYERYNVFAGKLKGNKDFAPIYLSDELWHTEYGNLLNVADQMLKSWSQNGKIDYYEFDYPKPIDWAFRKGALEDLESNQLTYNWNTKGAGYIIEDDYDVYAINRTGSLPVSYFPDGKEGQMEEKVYDAEELAYDFFSQLNNPDLVRVVQYAAFYQILTYFKDQTAGEHPATVDPSLPDYHIFDDYVERILRYADTVRQGSDNALYQAGLNRYWKRIEEIYDATDLLDEYIKKDPYGDFINFLENELDTLEYLSLEFGFPPFSVKETFRQYIDTNIAIVKIYIDEYKAEYGEFPYSEAAMYIVSSREIEARVEQINNKIDEASRAYYALYDKYYENLERLDEESIIMAMQAGVSVQSPNEAEEEDLYDQVFNRLKRIHNSSYEYYHRSDVNDIVDKWNANVALSNKLDTLYSERLIKIRPLIKQKERLIALRVGEKEQNAIGALNWLLTDPSPYNEPSGSFFADKLPQHKLWTKSPSMTCSFNGSGYGGHNLDAHVTPVKSSSNVPKGKCRVTFDDGNRVISVSKADRRRITPDVLRQVERRVAQNNSLIDLPPAPPTRPKGVLLTNTGMSRVERGYNNVSLGSLSEKPHNVRVGAREVKSVDDLVSARASQSSTSSQVRLKRYSEREALVEMDGQQYVLERSESHTVDLNDMSPDIQTESRGDNGAVILTTKPDANLNQGYKTAKVEIICPIEMVPDVKASLRSMMNNPAIDANNSFKIRRNIQMDLKRNVPNFNGQDIQLEEVLFSYILRFINQNHYEQFIQSYDAA